MEFQIPSLAVGALIAILTTVAGRILWRSIEKALNGSANLIWFVSHESAVEASEEFNELLLSLYGDARKQTSDWDAGGRFRNLQEYFRKAMISSALTIHNSGRVGAEGVTVLLAEDPQKIIVSPDVAIHKKSLADGQFELMFDVLRPSEQISKTLLGVRRYAIRRVAFKGAVAENLSYSKLLPTIYFERRQQAVQSIFSRVLTVTAVLVGIVSLLQAGIRRADDTANDAHDSQQVDK